MESSGFERARRPFLHPWGPRAVIVIGEVEGAATTEGKFLSWIGADAAFASESPPPLSCWSLLQGYLQGSFSLSSLLSSVALGAERL